jgi:hypothetical protein
MPNPVPEVTAANPERLDVSLVHHGLSNMETGLDRCLTTMPDGYLAAYTEHATTLLLRLQGEIERRRDA